MFMEVLPRLLDLYGESYSAQLGIDPKTDPFKWLLASVLFGAPIQESLAAKTYKEFEREGIVTPEEILTRGWQNLVNVLDRGGYVRYDFKTADKLLEMAQNVKDKGIPHSEGEIIGLAKGIGRVTATIFLRELRDFANVEVEPQEFVYKAAAHLGLIEEKSLQELKRVWREHGIEGYIFVNFEVALLRLGKNFCRKEKHTACGMEAWCSVHGQ